MAAGADGGWRILTILGVPIVLGPGMLLMMLLVAFGLGADVFPNEYPAHRYGPAVYAAMGAACAVLFFLSILLHEIAHCVLARLHRIPVKRVSMFIFGGVSELVHEPRTAGGEFAVSLAGPLASVAAGGLLWAGYFGLQSAGLAPGVMSVLRFAAAMNVLLGVTNLLPGFPLDGGRILRALVWFGTRDFLKATRVAVAAGRALGIAGVSGGVLLMLVGGLGALIPGAFLVMAGLFIERSARGSLRHLLLRRALGGVRVADVMRPGLPSVWEGLRISDVVEGYFLRYAVDSFPVVDHLGRLRGLLTSEMVRKTSPQKRRGLAVGAMFPRDVLPPVCRPGEAVDEIFAQMTRHGAGAMAVVDERGEVMGALILADVLDAAKLRMQFAR
jgi:Zn-dependent protease